MLKRKITITTCFLMGLIITINSQNRTIITDKTDQEAHESAILELSSDDKGFLFPRMNSDEKYAIDNPAESLIIFNNETKCLETHVDGNWNEIWCSELVEQDIKDYVYMGCQHGYVSKVNKHTMQLDEEADLTYIRALEYYDGYVYAVYQPALYKLDPFTMNSLNYLDLRQFVTEGYEHSVYSSVKAYGGYLYVSTGYHQSDTTWLTKIDPEDFSVVEEWFYEDLLFFAHQMVPYNDESFIVFTCSGIATIDLLTMDIQIRKPSVERSWHMGIYLIDDYLFATVRSTDTESPKILKIDLTDNYNIVQTLEYDPIFYPEESDQFRLMTGDGNGNIYLALSWTLSRVGESSVVKIDADSFTIIETGPVLGDTGENSGGVNAVFYSDGYIYAGGYQAELYKLDASDLSLVDVYEKVVGHTIWHIAGY